MTMLMMIALAMAAAMAIAMADPGTSLPAAAAPVGTPPPAMAPAAPVGGDDGFTRVPTSSIPGGDWHAVAEAAKKYNDMGEFADVVQQYQQMGYTAADAVAAANAYAESQGQGSAPTPPPGVTMDQMQKALDAFATTQQTAIMDTLNNHSTQQQQAADQARVVQDGQKVMGDAGNAFLSGIKMNLVNKGDDGADVPDPMATSLYLSYQDALVKQMRARIPEGATQAEAQAIMCSPTPDDITAANAAMEWAGSAKYDAAAAVAQEQEAIPNATLGGGPGGSDPPMDFDNATPDQQKEMVMSGVDVGDDD